MEILIILILLLLNGIFAMYEIALVSSSEATLETKAAAGSRKAREVLRQKEEPEKTLSAIQVGITLIGIVSGAFGGVALADDLVPLFASVPLLQPYAGKLAMVTVVACITYLSLIVGELVPKTLALNNPERIAMFLSSFMRFLTRVAYPFVLLLSASTKLVSKFFGINSTGERPITEDELKFILHQSSQQGVINKEETEMIKDVFRFGDKRVNELMTHRTDVVNLYTDQTREEVLSVIETKHFSKYLLYETSSVDECLGVVSVKDIVLLLSGDTPFDFRDYHSIGERINRKDLQLLNGHGYDHCFVLKKPALHELSFAATCISPSSGRRMDIYTTEPGLIMYTGNYLPGFTGMHGTVYPRRSAVCFETQCFPDTPNNPHFPSIVLREGECLLRPGFRNIPCQADSHLPGVVAH